MVNAFILKQKRLYGKATKEQKKFIAAMKASNALAGFARSVEEALRIVFPEEYHN